MEHLALYRKWRPIDFKGIVGQDIIIETLKKSIEKDMVAHAYLFSGVRGTGKTSTAKIFAKALNCLDLKGAEPCNKCANCLGIARGNFTDIIEIDAASNRGIEDIRDLRDKIKYLPVEGKRKVYIIDEVHMLTSEAFNALLKTLEEPPGHVVFILATTESYKLPLTILSRCQKFDFKKIEKDVLKGKLREIVETLDTNISEEALSLIVKVADGALRDGISLLDQCSTISAGEITEATVSDVTGIVEDALIFNMLEKIGKKDLDGLLITFSDLHLSGKSIGQILLNLMEVFKNLLISKKIKESSEVLNYTLEDMARLKKIGEFFTLEDIFKNIESLGDLERDLRYSSNPEILFEVLLINMIVDSSISDEINDKEALRTDLKETLKEEEKSEKIDLKKKTHEKKVDEIDDLEEDPFLEAENFLQREMTTEKVYKDKSKEALIGYSKSAEVNTRKKTTLVSEEIHEEIDIDIGEEDWIKALEVLKKRSKVSAYPFFIVGKFGGLEKKNVTILFDKKYAFHKERASQKDKIELVENILKELTGSILRVTTAFVRDEKEDEIDKLSPEDKLKDVFGDKLIIEE